MEQRATSSATWALLRLGSSPLDAGDDALVELRGHGHPLSCWGVGFAANWLKSLWKARSASRDTSKSSKSHLMVLTQPSMRCHSSNE